MNIPGPLRICSKQSTDALTAIHDGPLSTNPNRAIIYFLIIIRLYVHAFASYDVSYTILDSIRDLATAISFIRYWRSDLDLKRQSLLATSICSSGSSKTIDGKLPKKSTVACSRNSSRMQQ